MKVTFTAQGTDPDGDALTYEWDFDDGSAKASGSKATHTYTQAGTYDATVTAKDPSGLTHTATVKVVVGNAPGNQNPVVTATGDPKTGTSPLTVQFSSQATDPEGEGLMYVWEFGDGQFGAGNTATHTYTAAGTYTATLRVTDPKGGVGTATVQIVVTATPAAPAPPAAAAPKAPDAAPVVEPWFGVSQPAATSVAVFTKRGLAVKVTCTEAMTGSATLTVAPRRSPRRWV